MVRNRDREAERTKYLTKAKYFIFSSMFLHLATIVLLIYFIVQFQTLTEVPCQEHVTLSYPGVITASTTDDASVQEDITRLKSTVSDLKWWLNRLDSRLIMVYNQIEAMGEKVITQLTVN